MKLLARKVKGQSNFQTNKCLLSYINPHAAIAAEYRAIRNHIECTSDNNKLRSLIITSPSTREGKTTATVNLAISKAQHGEKVLIIDANMRNPKIHHIFQTNIAPGLANVLAGECTLIDVINQTKISNLDILPIGMLLNNAMEDIDSSLMDDLLSMVTTQYDCVLIDSAPVLDALNTNKLASKCDGIILVLSSGKTQNESALKAKRSLEFFSKAKIVGVIVNNS